MRANRAQLSLQTNRIRVLNFTATTSWIWISLSHLRLHVLMLPPPPLTTTTIIIIIITLLTTATTTIIIIIITTTTTTRFNPSGTITKTRNSISSSTSQAVQLTSETQLHPATVQPTLFARRSPSPSPSRRRRRALADHRRRSRG
jgi:hypothetical protein